MITLVDAILKQHHFPKCDISIVCRSFSISKPKPSGHWSNSANARSFFENLKLKFEIQDDRDWGNVTRKQLDENGGGGLISKMNGSVFKALQFAYPEKEWKRSDFINLKNYPNGHWNSVHNQREFLDKLEKELGITEKKEWGKVLLGDVNDRGGIGLLDKYNGSLFKALQAVYSEVEWNIEDFPNYDRVPYGFWKEMKHQREFMDKLAADLKVVVPEDWGSVTQEMIEKKNGLTLLSYYNFSLIEALRSIYPERVWKVEDFPNYLREKSGHWSTLEVQREFFDKTGKELGISKVGEWGKIPRRSIRGKGGGGLLAIYSHNVYKALRSAYPEHNWSGNKYADLPNFHHISKGQQKIWDYLHPLIPDLHMNFLHPELPRQKTGSPMELDFWSESLKFAIEYQGNHHYADKFKNSPLKYVQERDEEKRNSCKKLGITLIAIPYWWKEDFPSLLATIHKERPDVLHEHDSSSAKPISELPPKPQSTRRRAKHNKV